MKETIDLRDDFNKQIAFIVGVDRVEIRNGVAICSYELDSERYSCLKEAKIFIDAYKRYDKESRSSLVQPMREYIVFMKNILKKASEALDNKLLFIYDKKTQAIIDELQAIVDKETRKT